MEIKTVLVTSSRADLREWFEKYGEVKNEVWVPISLKPQSDLLYYVDVVEEALCFGWIDGIKKKQDGILMQRLSPRQKYSSWTELNKARARRLMKLGLMTPAGQRALPDMAVAHFKVAEPIVRALIAQDLMHVFLKMPTLYQRIKIDNIQSVIKNPELFEKRLQKLLTETAKHQLYGQWHDNGRLLEEE